MVFSGWIKGTSSNTGGAGIWGGFGDSNEAGIRRKSGLLRLFATNEAGIWGDMGGAGIWGGGGGSGDMGGVLGILGIPTWVSPVPMSDSGASSGILLHPTGSCILAIVGCGEFKKPEFQHGLPDR